MTTQQERFVEFWREEHGEPTYKWTICGDCHGEGTSVAYLGAYTQSDREEMGEEWYDFMDDMQRGVYDRACEYCGGSGKVKEFTGKAEQAWEEWQQEAAEDAAIYRAESGMGYY